MATDFDSTLKLIKSKGYWVVNFYPAGKRMMRVESTGRCKEIISENAVQFRGWDYPHVPQTLKELYVANNRMEAYVDFEELKEVWRFYESGQFIHIFAMEDDWREIDASYHHRWEDDTEPASYLSVIGTTYRLTEILAFIKNMITTGIYDEGLILNISLYKTNNRQLFISDFNRGPLMQQYLARTDTIQLAELLLTSREIEDNYLEIALRLISDLFEQFQWAKSGQPLDTLRDDQRKLINRQF